MNRAHGRLLRYTICFLLPLLLGAGAIIATEATSPAQELPRADNGLRSVIWPQPGSGTVLIAVAAEAGSQDEPQGRGGLSHYLEHLLFDGYDQLDERGVTEAFESLSAYVNAFTREQTTVFFVLTPREEAREAARSLLGMLTRSNFSEEVFAKEKKVILEELAKTHASANGLKEQALRAALWRSTPLEHPVEGSEASVEATKRSEVSRYWREHYTPAGMRLLISGDLPAAEMEEIASLFGLLPPAERATTRPDPLAWSGWGEWRSLPLPEAPAGAPSGMPPGMGGMGHGMSAAGPRPELAVVLAMPDAMATRGTDAELVARWLGAPDGPLARALVPAHATSLSVSRLPRDPRDLLEIRVDPAEGTAAQELLARTLGALSAAGEPRDLDVLRQQRAWRAERALTGQRLHYAAVFYGAGLAAARGPLNEALTPGDRSAAALREAARLILAQPRLRLRAAWVGEGGPTQAAPLPEPITPDGPAASAGLAPGPMSSFTGTLPNGVVVGLLPETGGEVFGVHLLVADRSLNEPAELPGVSDLIHRLLDAGTTLSGSRELARRFERAGIDVKVADSPQIPFDDRYNVPDFSYIRMEGPAGSLETGLELLAEMISAPAWDEAGWQSAVRGFEAARRASQRGGGPASRLLRKALVGVDSPLARPVAGEPGDAVPTAQQVRQAWGRWPDGAFATDRLILTVASPLPVEETWEIVSDLFGGGPPRPPRRGAYPPAAPAEQAAAPPPADSPQVSVLFGRTAQVRAEDRAALLAATDLLSDRMVAEIRERQGLAYRLGAGTRVIPGGTWILSASVGTRPDNAERVEELVRELMLGLAAEPPSAADLSRIAARARRGRMLRSLSAASRAYRLGRRLFEAGASPLDLPSSALAAVSPEQVQAAAKKYLDPGEFRVVVAP